MIQTVVLSTSLLLATTVPGLAASAAKSSSNSTQTHNEADYEKYMKKYMPPNAYKQYGKKYGSHKNGTDYKKEFQKEFADKYIKKYADSRAQSYADKGMSGHQENVVSSASKAKNKTQLDAWKAAGISNIKRYAPKQFQKDAEKHVEAEYKRRLDELEHPSTSSTTSTTTTTAGGPFDVQDASENLAAERRSEELSTQLRHSLPARTSESRGAREKKSEGGLQSLMGTSAAVALGALCAASGVGVFLLARRGATARRDHLVSINPEPLLG